MSVYENFFTKLHHIDVESKKIETREVEEGDLENYIQHLIGLVLLRPEDRLFEIKSNETEVVATIKKSLKEEIQPDEATLIIANRLLDTETKTQERYKVAEIQKGSLIQSYISINDISMYLIAKVEHNLYLDEMDFKKHIGLPYEKHILKTCLIKLDDQNNFDEIVVTDTNQTVSAYWWNDFLELNRLNSDETNTTLAFKAIEQVLIKKVKTKSPYDYYNLRNNLVGYFKTQTVFVFDNMIENVFGDYEPGVDNLDINELKTTVRELPNKKNFDRNFDIVKSRVNAYVKKSYQVNKCIDINIHDHIEDSTMIKSYSEQNGEKFISIKTDNEELYRMFE